jgi:AraC family transcriptional regulator, regulatory protein of adaptative response / methylated-DNA-[protein]-cysteine methyltransferase
MIDYALIKRALEFIATHQTEQPTTEVIAGAIGLTPVELNALFRRWCGLTPIAFLQALTLDHAKHLLRNKATVLDAAYETGLSGSGRLHDLFVTHEAMSPGEFRKGGAGLEMAYGFHPSPFGIALVVATPRGLAGMGFCDEGGEAEALADMQSRWVYAKFTHLPHLTAPYMVTIFENWGAPVKLFLIGTDFEVQVWETLLKIPAGNATTYGTIAGHINRPKASRAVGAAVGKNPISFVVPCHRVIGSTGALTGYHWGLTRKQAMLGWEKGSLG